MHNLLFNCVLVCTFHIVLGGSPTEIVLNDGYSMPPIACGTSTKMSEMKDVGPAVVFAIETGYRHFDTAPLYFNEAEIGNAIAKVIERGIVKRKDLFITTKLDAYTGRSAVLPAIRGSLQRLQLDYVDLYLIHTSAYVPTETEIDYQDLWKGMEEVKMMGLTKSIGLSNFNSTKINAILAKSRFRPAVNQIEVSPTFANLDLVSYCQSEGIYVMAYSPFGFLVSRPYRNVSNALTFDNPTFLKIARKYNKTPNQVVLRYLLDRGVVPMPKSFNRNDIVSNMDVFDFKLTRQEIYEVNALNQNIKLYDFNDIESLYEYYFGASSAEVWSRAANMNAVEKPQQDKGVCLLYKYP